MSKKTLFKKPNVSGTKSIKQSLLAGMIVICSCSLLRGQNVQETLQLANDYYSTNQYHTAIKTYQRVLFFGDKEVTFNCYRGMGQAYKKLRNWKKAAHYYDLAYYASSVDSLKQEMLLQKAGLLLKQQLFYQAQIELFNLSVQDSASRIAQRKQFYLAISYYGLQEYEKAQQYFIDCLSDTAQYGRKKTRELIQSVKTLKRPDPLTAQIMSAILPGLGQIYAGNIKSGLNSFLLTSAWIALGINTAFRLTVLDALVSITPWYLRYYVGGLQNAKEIAQHRLQEKRSQIYQQLLSLIAQQKPD